MVPAPSKLEAVRLTREVMGEAAPSEMAAHIESTYGIRLSPVIVTVLLATLRERAYLEETRQRALEAAATLEDPTPGAQVSA